MSQKKVNVANFNVVFLEEKDEAPLLKYFDSIVVPAFQSGIKKDNKDAELFFMNVEVVEDSEGEYVLVGYVVKKTVLEVKSDVDEKGNLIEKDEKYPSAPYSTFAIYLKNHRMVYVLNQKGSPNIKSFSGLTKHVKPIIDVEYADKTKGTIKEDQISEKMDIEFPGENVVEMDQVISKGKEIQSISYTSRGNQEIYNEHKSKIIKFLPKK